MYHLYLIRHGESYMNTGVNQIERYPDHAVKLTARGELQAAEAGEFLRKHLPELKQFVYLDKDTKIFSSIMWVSPYERTRQTAAIIAKRLNSLPMKEDSMLSELQFGIFDAIPKEKLPEVFPKEWAEYKRNRSYNGKYFARRPGGESPFDCEIRQKLWLDSLYRDIHSGSCPTNIIVVGHGAALTILRKAIFHHTHEWYEAEPNPSNCSIQHIVLDSHGNRDLGYLYGEPEKD